MIQIYFLNLAIETFLQECEEAIFPSNELEVKTVTYLEYIMSENLSEREDFERQKGNQLDRFGLIFL